MRKQATHTRVGIAGPIGSGKSYLAEKLENTILYAQVLPFAQALKKLCDYPKHGAIFAHIEQWEKIYGVRLPNSVVVHLYDAFITYPNVTGVKNRKLLQYVGTEIMRDWNPNIWIDCAIAMTNPRADVIIHDDVRFANEAAILDYLIEIEDPNPPEETHKSESREWMQARLPDYRLTKGFSRNDVSRVAIQILSLKK